MPRHGSTGEPPRPQQGPAEYGPPADPWGQSPAGDWPERRAWPGDYRPAGPGSAGHDPGYGEHRYGDPVYEAPQGPPEYGGYQPPAHPPPGPAAAPDPPSGAARRRPIGLYAVVAAIVLLAAAGVGYALYLLSGDESAMADRPATATTAPGDDGPSPAQRPEPTRDNVGMNAAMALVDDCLVNDGTTGQPQMRIVACDDPEASGQLFEVLEIFDERVEGDGPAANQQAQSICGDTDGYTHHYYEVGEDASFVLCMAELD